MKIATRDGAVTERTDGQEKLIGALYANAFGRMLLKPLTRPALSRMMGKFLSSRLSCVLIRPFIRRHKIDMQQFEDQKFSSYNEFFSRPIRPQARPIDQDPTHLISPCDSKLTVLPIGPDCRFTLKHTTYTAASLLRDASLAAAYTGGYALIFRLTVDDYHRYCYAADGEKQAQVHIPGVLHTVNPIANDYFPIYKENAREYCVIRTEAFGELIAMEVGALLVGKIVNHHPDAAAVRRGQEKGYFQFGGSTVVLLTKPGAVQIDADLLEHSRAGVETVVHLGEKIAAAAN